jgi:hypothetical protein
MEVNPDWAASQGYHKLDSVLVISDSINKKQLDFRMLNWIHYSTIRPGSLNHNTIDFILSKSVTRLHFLK